MALGLRRAWDARAWAEGRPHKVTPRPGADLDERWRAELAALGYRDPTAPVELRPVPVGALDREQAVERVLARLAAARSAWNTADVRGEVEQLLANAGIVAEAAVRIELAEDLTARALACCVPLLARDGVPEHVRAWTSPAVLAVEAELGARLAARGCTQSTDGQVLESCWVAADGCWVPADALDAGQAAAVTALAGDRLLIVVEGAAGASKTTILAAVRDQLEASGRRLLVVTPTLKAAKVAAGELGAAAGSAAWLAHQYGWRWNGDGAWTRLAVGQADPATGMPFTGPGKAARLRLGDLLVVDEAGMLDQDTARALLAVADEYGARVALLGDRHQLPAVGRGGVLDLAVRRVDPAAQLTLDTVHRFVRVDADRGVTPDAEYAELTLAMRTGEDPGGVFDALAARRQIWLHPNPDALREALAADAAGSYAAGERVAIVVDTRAQAGELNTAMRDRLVAAGRVDDRQVVVTRAGERIGVGDRVATRRNDHDLAVANRDTWTVTAVGRRGGLLVTPEVTPGAGVPAEVTPAGVGPRVLPAGYVTAHVELAYANTAHGAQGDTVTAAHLVIGEHTGAASAYVGMTRGRQANTAHLVAADLEEAREQWTAVFTRDRADLGAAHAAEQAAAEAARYAERRPLAEVVAELHEAWTVEQRCLAQIADRERLCPRLREAAAVEAAHAGPLAEREVAYRRAADAAARAARRVQARQEAVTAETGRLRDGLLAAWDAQRDDARAAAAVVLRSAGRLTLRRGPLTTARRDLTAWANTWRPHLPGMPTDPRWITAWADRSDDRPGLTAAFAASARRAAEAAYPLADTLRAAAEAARAAEIHAARALADARGQRFNALRHLGVSPSFDMADELAPVEQTLTDIRAELASAQQRIAQLTAEPALRAQPPDRLDRERDAWRQAERGLVLAAQQEAERRLRAPRHAELHYVTPTLSAQHSHGRDVRR